MKCCFVLFSSFRFVGFVGKFEVPKSGGIDPDRCRLISTEFDRVNEIYGQNFISDLVIKNKPGKNKINYKDTASNNTTSKLPCLTSHEAQAEKSKTLEDALAKLGKNIKEKRKNEKK